MSEPVRKPPRPPLVDPVRLTLAARKAHLRPDDLAKKMIDGDVPSQPPDTPVWFRTIRRSDLNALHDRLWPDCTQCGQLADDATAGPGAQR